MGRKTKITREMILDAAYGLLDESGISAVGIKPISSRLGCSTQPISWQFGSMTELRRELFFYASGKVNSLMASSMAGREAVEAFFLSGVVYLTLACDHPHLFRFLCVDDPSESVGEDISKGVSIFSMQFDKAAVKMISEQYEVSSEALGAVVRDVVIYTHGLATMMIYDSMKLPKDIACKMMFDLGDRMLEGIGLVLPDKQKKAIFKSAGSI